MSTIGPVLSHDATIGATETISSEIDIGGSYGSVSIMIPSMASKTTAFIQAASESGGTYYDVYYAPTSAAAPVQFQVHADVNAGAMVELPVKARYIKVKVPSAPAADAEYKLICSCN